MILRANIDMFGFNWDEDDEYYGCGEQHIEDYIEKYGLTFYELQMKSDIGWIPHGFYLKDWKAREAAKAFEKNTGVDFRVQERKLNC